MSQSLAEFIKPIECISTGLSLSEYADVLSKDTSAASIVIIDGRRPIAMMSMQRYGRMLKHAAQHGVTPEKLFQSSRRKLPILPGQLAVEKLFKQLEARDLKPLQEGCLVAENNRLIGILDYHALVAAMLSHIQAQDETPPPIVAAPTPTETVQHTNPTLEMGMLAHEIRTPLTGITGLAELLERRVRDKESRSMAASLVRTSRALDRLLTDTLDFASLQAGKLEMASQPCNLLELVSDLQQIWSHDAARRNLSYEVEFWPNGPHHITTDLGRLRQIANNLVSNALKFTEDGGVTVSLSTQPLRDNLMLMLSVTDTGKGLSKSDQTRFRDVFEKSQAHDQTPGWGLGLTISNALAQKLGGELGYSENPAGGSVFSLTIPVESTPMNKKPGTSSDRVRRGKFDLGEVLLVEDHEASAMIALQILENAGWQVRVAGSLDQAQIHLTEKTFQAVLTDIHLPDGDALNLIESIRKHSVLNSNTPIIAMTADISPARRQACLAAGADRAIKKPLQGPALVACLADTLMARAAERGAAPLRGRLAS